MKDEWADSRKINLTSAVKAAHDELQQEYENDQHGYGIRRG